MADDYLGDLNKTQLIYELFETPHDARDADWIARFFENVADASFCDTVPQVIQGPDGFPYFVLNLPEAGKPFQCFVLRHLKDCLLKEGVGVVIEPAQGNPQWVFSYGDIVEFHLKGNFELPGNSGAAPEGHSTEIVQEAEEVLVAQPSESFLPSAARQVLRQFLVAQGLPDPRILLMSRPKRGSVVQELVFALDRDKIGGEAAIRGLLQAISWFLPREYRFCAMKEESFAGSFAPL